MNYTRNFSFILLGLILTALSCGQKNNKIQDYINAGKVIEFNKVKYNLVWSAHPSDNYYKQEYIPENETLEKFRKLILFEVLTGNTQIKDAVAAKVAELKKMKETDPMANYALFEKDGEVMLDFLLSKNMSEQNDMNMIERNVYRYKSFTGNEVEKGVILFGVCERAYGDDIDNFLLKLKENRFALPEALSAFVIPLIKIAK